MHSNCITLSYYSSPKHKECVSQMIDTIPFTSVHSNLEHGLAILTESFSPLRSLLHNLSCWSPKQNCHGQAMLSLILSTWHACWASSHWFNLIPSNLNCWCKACYMPSGKFHCCLVMLLIDKLDVDVMNQILMMESSIVTAKVPFVLWTNTNVILSHYVNRSRGWKSHNFSFD